MKDSQSVRSMPLSLVIGVCVLILAVGGGISWWVLKSRTATVAPEEIVVTPTLSPSGPEVPITPPDMTPPVTPAPPVTASPQPQPTVPSPVGATAELWYIQDTQGQLDLIPHTVALGEVPGSLAEPQAKLQASFNHLLTHQENGNLFSSIPPGTQIQRLTVEPDGVHVDLSPEFEQGGGSTAMIARLGQVVYTASSMDPEVPVWLSINGKPLEYLGGEGLEVPQPITRSLFEKSFLTP